jgi:putative MATE family efflux protein
MNFTTGSIHRKIISFSIPLFIGSVLQQVYSISDSIIAGKLIGSEALAAISAAMPVIKVSIALTTGITLGISVVVSHLFGADDTLSIRQTIITSYIFFTLSALILTLIGVVASRYILIKIGVPAEILDDATRYMQIIFIGTTPKVGYDVANSIYRGIGNSYIPLVVLVFSTLLNIVLDIFFIAVLGMGIRGTAWATILAQATSFLLSFAIFTVKYPNFRFRFAMRDIKYVLLKRMMRIGAPSGLKALLYWGGYTLIASTVNRFGTATIAAFGIASKIDLFMQTPQGSLANGLSAFVGQNIGAQKPDRIRKATKTIDLVGIAIALITTAGIYLFSEKIIRLFTHDTEIIAIGVRYLRAVSPFYVIYALQEVVQGVAVGSGHTIILMISTIVAMWLVRIPVAFILSKHIGSTGIWLSIPSGWFVAMLFTNGFYLSKKWEK